ncbi:MAG: hypothetical protein IKK85_04305 [Clostridia bacterium]|nr:hypothetical protein [Clostridia bacterium]
MKKLLALLLAAAMLLSFAACGEETPDPVTDESTTLADETLDANATEAPTEEASEEVSEDVSETEPVSVEDETSEPVSEEESSEAEETTAPAVPAVPASKDEIISYYNTAVNKAVAAKVGFNKLRYVDNEQLNAGILLKTFGDVMYKFMGIGAENKYTMDVTKGQWESDLPHQYLRKSTLSAADVTDATCTVNGTQYTIVMGVKGGTSYADKKSKSNNSPIDKCGICVGDGDKSYFDHKTAIVIYDAIDDILGGAKVSESYKNAKVKAVIDSTTGNLVSLTVEYDINVVIDTAGGGNATGSSHIIYKNFKY